MDPVRVYDVHTRARQRLFDWIRPLGQEQYTREFPFGKRTLRATMVEIAATELYLAMRLRGEPSLALDDWPISEEHQPTFADLERVWAVQAPQTRSTLAGIDDWDRIVETRLSRRGRSAVLIASLRDIATQLLLHEVHHRAQAMAMLRQLGVEAQNLDYIGFTQQRRTEPA